VKLKPVRYSVFETTASGAFTKVGELDAACDSDALKRARQLLATGAGELREDMRIVCRFGRSEPFRLQD
jgi:phosphoribosyl-AMP cyclohydrolase